MVAYFKNMCAMQYFQILTAIININYYIMMAFFISHILSVRGHFISTRALA